MKIVVTSILVDDQAKALAFYHHVLGFQPKEDIAMGRYRWLTLTSPNDPNGVELLLEPDAHPAAKTYKAALKADGIPATSFAVRDIQAEYTRLHAGGVLFTQPPTPMGPVTVAVFDDTCGNLIQIAQRH
ncbi:MULTISPECIES: VOC family protein [Pseudomonas]|uniref:VOC family protein n=1 Tax=Pseudomonas machongensis TaxID=3110229 RepID=A0ABU5VBX7_9PSED|nr:MULTISPECIES: VOC family protein [Pseudomonas]ANC03545.1 glyoxalase [Pseudomonas putida]KAB5625641.1 VOC family protein [Pseudomonas putida]MBH3460164.1 VOC family protein [Pseudomonas putida]MBK0059507.1 VOC family protein [Pseudomonas sp. S44]MEA5670871.1 VOC family protein [Pseudomonas sp. MH2]